MRAGYVAVFTEISTWLHRRAKTVSKHRHITIAQLIRDGLEERVEYLEAKDLDVEERKLDEKKKTQSQRRESEPVNVSLSKLPLRHQALFEDQAARIARVIEDADAAEEAEKEAFRAIRRVAPITYRKDEKIRERLDPLVSAIVEKMSAPPTPTFAPTKSMVSVAERMLEGHTLLDPLIGKTIDSSRVKTRGVIEDTADSQGDSE